MWVFLNDAYLSIVQDENPDYLLVRGRVKGDIERVFPKAKVAETKLNDYLFRAKIKRDDVAEAMSNEVNRINYTNFKDSVKEKDRHNAYLYVWSVMSSYQERLYRQQPWHLRTMSSDELNRYSTWWGDKDNEPFDDEEYYKSLDKYYGNSD